MLPDPVERLHIESSGRVLQQEEDGVRGQKGKQQTLLVASRKRLHGQVGSAFDAKAFKTATPMIAFPVDQPAAIDLERPFIRIRYRPWT